MNKGRETRGESWMFLNLRILIDISLLMISLDMLRMIISGYCRKLRKESMSKFQVSRLCFLLWLCSLFHVYMLRKCKYYWSILSISCIFCRVGLELATIEVRFSDLFVEAECEVVYGKPIPTLWNAIASRISVSETISF